MQPHTHAHKQKNNANEKRSRDIIREERIHSDQCGGAMRDAGAKRRKTRRRQANQRASLQGLSSLPFRAGL